jgi:hypothetical protein
VSLDSSPRTCWRRCPNNCAISYLPPSHGAFWPAQRWPKW